MNKKQEEFFEFMMNSARIAKLQELETQAQKKMNEVETALEDVEDTVVEDALSRVYNVMNFIYLQIKKERIELERKSIDFELEQFED